MKKREENSLGGVKLRVLRWRYRSFVEGKNVELRVLCRGGWKHTEILYGHVYVMRRSEEGSIWSIMDLNIDGIRGRGRSNYEKTDRLCERRYEWDWFKRMFISYGLGMGGRWNFRKGVKKVEGVEMRGSWSYEGVKGVAGGHKSSLSLNTKYAFKNSVKDYSYQYFWIAGQTWCK